MTKFNAPSPPYLGPAKFHGGDGNKPIDRIVLHSTVGPSDKGSAANIARYFRVTVTRPSSAHYVIDAGGAVQVVHDSVVAYHDGQNTHELGLEMCDYPTKDVRRWSGHDHAAVLHHTATLVAELCLAYNVPPYFRSVKGLRTRRRGVTTHAVESGFFRKSTHWDPGAFPTRAFMKMVRAEIRRLKADAK